MAYTTVTKIEDYLNINVAPSFEDTVESWIEEATAFIDNRTQTNFESYSTSKYYDGDNSSILYIDDFTEITEVAINGTAVAVQYSNTTPIYRIKMPQGVFPAGMDNIKVTGKHGFSEEPPKDIEMAATVIAAGLIYKEGAKVSESLENLSITYKDEKGLADFNNALQTIKSYRKDV